MPLPSERAWTNLYGDKMSDKIRAELDLRIREMNWKSLPLQPINSDIDDLRREVSDLREIITELVLRIDLQNLGIDPKEIFLPGLKIGR